MNTWDAKNGLRSDQMKAARQIGSYKAQADAIAAMRGGICVSKEIQRSSDAILWKCHIPEHPVWKAPLQRVRGFVGHRGSWCPNCANDRRAARRQYSYKFIFDYLNERGMDLLSSKYIDSTKKLNVRFRSCGHDGNICFNQIQQGGRCAKCAHNAPITKYEYLALALVRGGQLIEMARSVKHPSTWLCSRGHKFSRSYASLAQAETFCTVCSAGLAERQCKAAVEQLFRAPFRKVRLKELRGVGGGALELDIYNASLKLAIEHNGHQHYEPQTNWGGRRAFDRQVEHDRRRREYCKREGIILIEIRELNDVTHFFELKTIIKDECLKGCVPLPLDYDEIKLDLSPIGLKTIEEEIWNRVQQKAKAVGYTIFSTGYPGIHEKLKLVCDRNHKFTPTTANFLSGHLCRKCWLNRIQIPVVAFPLTSERRRRAAKTVQVFDSIEEAARAIGANPNHVRQTLKRKVLTCKGYGLAQIAPAQAIFFKNSPGNLREFCEQRWPNWESFDSYAKLKLLRGKPVIFSDGREFESASEAARMLGVTKAAVLRAIRVGGRCCGCSVRRINQDNV